MQKVTLFYPANGSRQYATAYFGERTAKLEGTVRFDNDTFYNYFLTGMDTFHHFNVAFNGPVISRHLPPVADPRLPHRGLRRAGVRDRQRQHHDQVHGNRDAWHDRQLSVHGPGTEHRYQLRQLVVPV